MYCFDIIFTSRLSNFFSHVFNMRINKIVVIRHINMFSPKMLYNCLFSNDFIFICKEILEQNKSEKQWAEIESDDMFQKGSYEGGFDATEMLFCFSVYENECEYWFEFPLSEVELFANGIKLEVSLTKADS